MGVRKIVECELDGPSIVVWESGKGTRVVYHTNDAADRACQYLIRKANQFHMAKEANDGTEDSLMVTVECYGEPMSEFQFVRRFLKLAELAGLEVQKGLTRPQGEYW